MTLDDVLENNEYGEFAENHYSYLKPKVMTGEEVITCRVAGQACKSVEESNKLSGAYRSN